MMIKSIISAGHCITTALPDAVCALDAATIECEIVNLTAVSCLCAPGYHYTDSLCEGMIISFTISS